jgi:mRNA-degrading endonuclease RelE of RelBE toxin-antitoxin system
MKIVITERCGKRVRKLSKKYVSIVNDFRSFLNSLHQNPFKAMPLAVIATK